MLAPGTVTSMNLIEWSDFEKVELRVGTIVRAEHFPEARKSAFKVWVDFGEFGIRQSSAQITIHYTCDSLVGLQVVAVLNFPPKRIADFESQVLVCGFDDGEGNVVLVSPTKKVTNGAKLF